MHQQIFLEKNYEPILIEARWQEQWENLELFRVKEDSSNPKYYLLEMFPYPSGRIHMGHMRVYTIGDALARLKRMQGFNVLHSIGWDAFGMPAENAAIAHAIHPAKWTYENIAYMKRQLKGLGFTYDWKREIATCDASYYRWEQLVFLRMWQKGLVYRKQALVNWCECCKTVLANEQVKAGCCWRCNQVVGQKSTYGYFFKITAYAEELLNWLDKLPGWPQRVLTMQRNWIGRSYGVEIHFSVENYNEVIKIFTTKVETLFGATFISLAPEHPLALALSVGTNQEQIVKDFIDRIKRQSFTERADQRKKEGCFTGAWGLNPVTNLRMPIYIANFVLMDYGRGAVMAVPAHDQRDFEFAQIYSLPIIEVIVGPDGPNGVKNMSQAFIGEGVLVNSGEFSGLSSFKAKKAITTYLKKQKLGSEVINYRLRDWGISRQRYWGAPIPMVHCKKCGIVPVKETDLPVVLPLEAKILEGGSSPLPLLENWLNVSCPCCDGLAKRETDTMDTFVESSWYFARYTCPDYVNGPLEVKKVDYWMPVDQYVGGIEHAILHLLYSRFYTKVLRDLGLINVHEPFLNLLIQGMVIKDGAKMSKSKGNVVDPDEIIKKYGVDTVRLFILFAAPPEKDLEWSEHGVEGAARFLTRLWRLGLIVAEESKGVSPYVGGNDLPNELNNLHRKVHQTIKKYREDIFTRFQFNTAIAAIMELVNEISLVVESNYKHKYDNLIYAAILREAIETAVILVSPIAPHLADELWEQLGHEGCLITYPLPNYDETALARADKIVVIGVAGKVRARLTLPAEADEETIKSAALADSKIQALLKGCMPKKIIIVHDKLVNIVL